MVMTDAQRVVVSQPGGELEGVPLTAADRDILERDLYRGILGDQSVVIRRLFETQREVIAAALAIAKNKMQASFAGAFASDTQIAVQLIRAPYLRRTTGATETPTTGWNFTFASGADDWIGFGSNNATAINVDKRLCMALLGLQFTGNAQPVVEEIEPTRGGISFPAQVIRQAWYGDNETRQRLTSIRPIVLAPRDTFLVDVVTKAAEDQELVFLGVAFALGSLARTAGASITTVQT